MGQKYTKSWMPVVTKETIESFEADHTNRAKDVTSLMKLIEHHRASMEEGNKALYDHLEHMATHCSSIGILVQQHPEIFGMIVKGLMLQFYAIIERQMEANQMEQTLGVNL